MKTLNWVIIAILISACGKVEEFRASRQFNDTRIQLRKKHDLVESFTPNAIKPKVDFLFIWDNSSSQTYVSNATKLALASTITKISNEFDYRILFDTLFPTSPGQSIEQLSSYASIFSPSQDDITNSEHAIYWLPINFAPQKIASVSNGPPAVTGARENGIERALHLLNAARNGIFRKQSHVIIVLISNGDDNTKCNIINGYEICDPNIMDVYKDYLVKLTGLGLNDPTGTLNSKQVRFLSLVPFDNPGVGSCKSGTKKGWNYRDFSKKVYNEIPVSSDLTKPYVAGPYPDSFNFCSSSNFQTLFQGINNTIRMEMPYTYVRWPAYLTPTKPEKGFPYNLNDFRVTKVDYYSLQETPIAPSFSYGWSWSSYVGETGSPTFEENQPLWSCTPGHSSSLIECDERTYNGYFIKLNDTAQIKWPDIIRIKTSDPPDYYGYVKVDFKPLINASYPITVVKNGVQIPTSEFKYKGEIGKDVPSPFNIKIKSPADFSPDLDHPENHSNGFIIQLDPQWTYSNGDFVEVGYDPTGY